MEYRPTNEDFGGLFNNTMATMSRAALENSERQRIAQEAEAMFKGASGSPTTADFNVPPPVPEDLPPGVPRTRDTVQTDNTLNQLQPYDTLRQGLQRGMRANPNLTTQSMTQQGLTPQQVQQILSSERPTPDMHLQDRQFTIPSFTQGTATPDFVRERELQQQLPLYGQSAVSPVSGPYSPAPDPVADFGENWAKFGARGTEDLLMNDTRRRVAEIRAGAAMRADPRLAQVGKGLAAMLASAQKEVADSTNNGLLNLMTASPEQQMQVQGARQKLLQVQQQYQDFIDRVGSQVTPGTFGAGSPAYPQPGAPLPSSGPGMSPPPPPEVPGAPAGPPPPPPTMRDKIKDKTGRSPMSWADQLPRQLKMKYLAAFNGPENAGQDKNALGAYLQSQAIKKGDLKTR